LDAAETAPAEDGLLALIENQRRLTLREIEPQQVELRGRDALLDELLAEAAQCLGKNLPTLSTVQGEAGLGKTRILYTLARTLRGLYRDQSGRIYYLRASSAEDGEPYSAARQLLRLVLRLGGECSADELDAAWDQLGAIPAEAGRHATAYLLGAIPREAPELQPIMATPGALRQSAARALATALIHLAEQDPLVLLIDDAHAADHVALDALEIATMGEPVVPLGVWVATLPMLATTRPRWSDRAPAGQVRSLAPLDHDDANELLLDLLRPVEFVPGPVLDRLYDMSGGIPLYLTELARAARSSGAIRQHGDESGGYYIAADELLRSADVPVDERLAQQALAAVPAPLAPLVQLCALLGEFTEDDLLGVQAVLRQYHSSIDVDISAGLDRLARMAIIEPRASGYAVRQAVLARAIDSLIPAERRSDFHAAVVDHWQAAGSARPDRLAHHAARAGATGLAAQTYLDLAEESRAQHRYVDAEHQYSRALEYLSADSDSRGRALGGRGQAR
ncbi:MAG: AAA family ATPase, partial [Myxococcota bacterium]